MAKIGSLIEKLFKKAGIDITSEELKSVIELDTEVPDETVSQVDKALMTVEAAKNNSEVNKVLRQKILSSADNVMNEMIVELGLQPDETFAANTNSYEKIKQVVKLAFETGGKSKGGKQSNEDFVKKEAEYQKQLKELKEGFAIKEKEFASARENDLTSFELQKILLGKDYVFPKEMDTDLKVSTAMRAVQNELSKNGLSIKRGEAGQLLIVDKEGNPAYNQKDNEAYEPATFIDGALAQNKLLRINGEHQQQTSSPGVVNQEANKGNQKIVAELEAQLATMS